MSQSKGLDSEKSLQCMGGGGGGGGVFMISDT